MNFQGASPAAIAGSVWNFVTRRLTSMNGAMTPIVQSFTSIAASSSVNIAPGPNIVFYTMIGIQAGAAGNVAIRYSDGSNLTQQSLVTSGSTAVTQLMMATSTLFVQLANLDVTNAAHYYNNGHSINCA